MANFRDDIRTEGDNPDEIRLAMQFKARLDFEYPLYPWLVGVDFDNGVCSVKLGFNSQYGVLLHMRSAASASEFEKMLLWAGGELLERLCLPRDHAPSSSDILDLNFGVNGQAVYDAG